MMYLNRIFSSPLNVLISWMPVYYFLKSSLHTSVRVSPAFRSNLFAQRWAKRIFTTIRFKEPGLVLFNSDLEVRSIGHNFQKYLSTLRLSLVQIVVLLFFAINATAQVSYKGIWQGYITAPGSYNSGYSLHIEDHSGDRISGTAYIYRNQDPLKFDGVLDFIGTVNQGGSKITELVILKEKMPHPDYMLCVKFMGLELVQKDSTDFLTGNWDGSLISKYPCLPGNVYLRRHNPLKPRGIEPIPNEVLEIILADKSSKMNFLNTELAKPIIINVRNPVIKFEIRDYLKEDFDTVSIYLNRRPLVQKIGIFKKPYKQTFRLDKNSELNEIILYAENLGFIPPNTSNLTIIDGERKHQLIIRSTKQVSAVVYLRYKPDGT